MEDREDKGKKSNAYVHIMNGQKSLQILTIFMDACSGTPPSVLVKLSKRNTLFFKKGSHPMPKKLQQSCTQGLGSNF